MQVLLSIPSIQDVYFNDHMLHIEQCYESPAECFKCQMGKLANGLLSGLYSNEALQNKNGISPSMFKQVIGKGHQEFSTMRQQDAQEFLQHVLSTIERKEKTSVVDPSKKFEFKIENRLQCLQCEKVHYTSVRTSSIILQVPAKTKNHSGGDNVEYENVDFMQMLDGYFSADMRDYQCPIEKTQTLASVIQKFENYPEYLICVASRFILGSGWVMEKLSMNT